MLYENCLLKPQFIFCRWHNFGLKRMTETLYFTPVFIYYLQIAMSKTKDSLNISLPILLLRY